MKKLLFILLALSNCTHKTVVQTEECDVIPTISDTMNKNILVIGDSISEGYLPFLRSDLTEYDVFHNPCNAQSSSNGKKKINEWLKDPSPIDMIVFNFGLWDISSDVSVETYRQNLIYIVERMKLHTNNILFLTTTTIANGDDDRMSIFKETALQVMSDENVNVFDLDTYVLQENIPHGKDNVHYTASGYEKMAQKISEVIREINQ